MTTFTEMATPWLNKFTTDLGTNKEAVLAVVDKFDGDQAIVRKAIELGPDKLDQTDTNICKELFHFIEFYSTGHYHKIEVSRAEEQV